MAMGLCTNDKHHYLMLILHGWKITSGYAIALNSFEYWFKICLKVYVHTISTIILCPACPLILHGRKITSGYGFMYKR